MEQRPQQWAFKTEHLQLCMRRQADTGQLYSWTGRHPFLIQGSLAKTVNTWKPRLNIWPRPETHGEAQWHLQELLWIGEGWDAVLRHELLRRALRDDFCHWQRRILQLLDLQRADVTLNGAAPTGASITSLAEPFRVPHSPRTRALLH
jgi:hypothetical protein